MQQWVRFSAKVAAGFLSAWFLLLPVTANALGLGNIKMDSALNEPLKAKIQLLSANSDDIKGLEVKLASRQAFMRAGVDRTSLLSNIKFNIVKQNDKYFVILSTNESIREPFLNFLVELNYKNGRMLREYTVLLDPAHNAGEQQQAAEAPETTPPATPAPQVSSSSSATAPAPTSPFMTGSEDEPSAPLSSAPAAPSNEPQAAQPESPLIPENVPAPSPKPETKMAKAATAPAPAPVPEAVPAPAPAPVEAATPAPAPTQPFAVSSNDNGELFPAIPLTAYKESGPTGPTAANEPAAAPAPAPAVQPAGELDYGITKKGDNLWDIARKLKPNNQVTIYQVMMALQKSNPKAFIHGNIHRLKIGQVMRIADPSLLSAMSKAQALKQYQVQTGEWQTYLASSGANVPRQVINAGEQAQAPSTAAGPSGELTLSTPSSKSAGAGTGSSEAESNNSSDAALLEQQARKAMQAAKKQRKHNAELTAKLDDLDAELKRMQNLVNIKDSDLAELQHKLDELNKQRAASELQPETAQTQTAETKPQPVAPAPATETSQPATAPAAATPPSTPAQPATAPAETNTASNNAAQPETPAAPPAPQPGSAAPTTPAKPATPAAPPVAAPAAPAPTPMPATAKSSGGIMGTIKGFFSGVMGGLNTMMLIIGGVIIVVILLLVFILVRRRKGVNFQESILNGSGASDEPMTMDSSPSQGSSLMGGESSFLSDFAISGVSAIQAEDSEVDPLTEADVFMAYGRYEAAEERLQEAVNQDPGRGELRVKLLELYNTTKNSNAFETAAEDFYASLGSNAGSNPLWQKVVAMGRSLAPHNPLFSGGVAAPTTSAQEPTPAPDFSEHQDVMDIGLDTGAFNTSDFNTDVFNEPAGSTASAAESAADEADSILNFNLDTDTSSAPAKSTETDMPDAGGLDFNLDMDSSAGSSDAGQDMDFALDLPGSDEGQDGGLDFNLDSGESTASTEDNLDFNLDLEGDNEPTATDIKLGMEGEESSMAGLDFDFSESDTAEGHGANGTDLNLDMSAGDEVGTKLDLARAYIDMGDPDGARSILDEVLEEGNDGQKQEAQQLMTQIG